MLRRNFQLPKTLARLLSTSSKLQVDGSKVGWERIRKTRKRKGYEWNSRYRISMMGGHYRNDPAVITGTETKLAYTPTWESALLTQGHRKDLFMLQRVNDEESTKFNRLNTHPGQTFDPMRHRTEVTKKNQKMFFSAMKSREQFDYGINASERAEFAHRRVKDEYLDNWMTTDPNANNVTGVDLRSPLTRQKIAQEPEIWKRVFLYERERDFKYVIHPFRKSALPNMSFWNQHITKTRLVRGRPAVYSQIGENAASRKNVANLAQFCAKTIELAKVNFAGSKNGSKAAQLERARRESVVKAIWNHAQTLAGVSPEFSSTTDEKPEVLYFWMRGYAASAPGETDEKYEEAEPAKFQSVCAAVEQTRIGAPLPPLRARASRFCSEAQLTAKHTKEVASFNELKLPVVLPLEIDIELRAVPWFDYAPEALRFYKQQWRNYVKPGFHAYAGDMLSNYDMANRRGALGEVKKGISSEDVFSHTQVSTMPAEFERSWFAASEVEHPAIESEIDEALKSQAIINGFTWTAALAHYQGHFQDDDVEVPIVAQLVNFDGEQFCLSSFQLNTLAIDPENDYWNKTVNLCYVEKYSANEFEALAEHLLKFAANRPSLKIDEKRVEEEERSFVSQVQLVDAPDIAIQQPWKFSEIHKNEDNLIESQIKEAESA